jgi:PIN domain nuclease of toxin-antitoxin system
VVVLDTHALIFDALTPERLSPAARAAIERGEATRSRPRPCTTRHGW